MSLRALTTVWAESKATGTLLLLELAIADTANDQGWAWPGIDFLAQKSRMSRRSVVDLLQRLEEIGELQVERNAGPRGTNMYLLLLVSKGAIPAPPVQPPAQVMQPTVKIPALPVQAVAPVQDLHGAIPAPSVAPEPSVTEPHTVEVADAPEWPALEQVLELARSYPGNMHKGIPAAIPELWAQNYYHFRTFERQEWPKEWQKAMVFKFEIEWQDGRRAARGQSSSKQPEAGNSNKSAPRERGEILQELEQAQATNAPAERIQALRDELRRAA